MPTPVQFKADFEFDCFYHLLFRSIDGIPLFNTEKHRGFFLDKFHRFTADLFQLWSYSLLDNHAHFIIKVKPEAVIRENLHRLSAEEKTKPMIRFLMIPAEMSIDQVAERQINSFMVSYANTYNNFIGRKGGVFQQPFRRSIIAEEVHLQQAIIYVHANAQKHQLVKDFKEHAFHSYHQILDGNSFCIDCVALIDFFGGKEQFIAQHKEQVAYFYTHHWPDSKLEID